MHKDTFFYKNKTITTGGKVISLNTPLVMGILNVTPDSFYDGGKFISDTDMIQQVRKMLNEGADIIDVGACSTRPGADALSSSTELERLRPALSLIRNEYPEILLSIDTFRTEVAARVVDEFEVNIINDISAGEMEHEILSVAAENHIPLIAMHMQGKPENMQNNPKYEHVVYEVLNYFSERVSTILEAGVNDVIIDPGFGFGKTLEQNYQLLGNLELFGMLEQALMVGISRKSMIYKHLNTNPGEALNGSTVLHTIALQKGAGILRVHDVKEAKECIEIYSKLVEETNTSTDLLNTFKL